jgi:hypothetical protein
MYVLPLWVIVVFPQRMRKVPLHVSFLVLRGVIVTCFPVDLLRGGSRMALCILN